jgi:hypothetical protein
MIYLRGFNIKDGRLDTNRMNATHGLRRTPQTPDGPALAGHLMTTIFCYNVPQIPSNSYVGISPLRRGDLVTRRPGPTCWWWLRLTGKKMHDKEEGRTFIRAARIQIQTHIRQR